MIPKTWENPNHSHPELKAFGTLNPYTLTPAGSCNPQIRYKFDCKLEPRYKFEPLYCKLGTKRFMDPKEDVGNPNHSHPQLKAFGEPQTPKPRTLYCKLLYVLDKCGA